MRYLLCLIQARLCTESCNPNDLTELGTTTESYLRSLLRIYWLRLNLLLGLVLSNQIFRSWTIHSASKVNSLVVVILRILLVRLSIYLVLLTWPIYTHQVIEH